MSNTMHAWPKRDEPTTCCGRHKGELPLSDGRTTDPRGVNCDGNFVPAVWAHEVYPHPDCFRCALAADELTTDPRRTDAATTDGAHDA